MSTLILRSPVKSLGKEVTSLEFREPKGNDMIHCGSPYMVVQGADDDSGGVIPIPGAIAKYIARLAGITPGAVKDLAAKDFMAASEIVMGFFGDGPEEASGAAPTTGSSSPTTSPDSGASAQTKH